MHASLSSPHFLEDSLSFLTSSLFLSLSLSFLTYYNFPFIPYPHSTIMILSFFRTLFSVFTRPNTFVFSFVPD